MTQASRTSASLPVEEELTRVLGAWAVGSVLLGAALSLSPRTRGFGRQTAAWGRSTGPSPGPAYEVADAAVLPTRTACGSSCWSTLDWTSATSARRPAATHRALAR